MRRYDEIEIKSHLILVLLLPIVIIVCTMSIYASSDTYFYELTSNPGEMITVPVKISDVDLVSLSLCVEFDPTVFTLLGLNDTGLIPGAMHGSPTQTSYMLLWENDLLDDNMNVDGIVAYLYFKVSDKASLGENEITFSTPKYGIIQCDGKCGTDIHGEIDIMIVASTNERMGSVFGRVTSYNPDIDTIIDLKQNDSIIYSTKITGAIGSRQATQNFEITGVVPGTYDLVVSRAGHLDYTIHGIVVSDHDINLTTDERENISNIRLLCGDIDGNGYINPDDLGVILRSENYGKTTAEAVNPLCDLDGNGYINPDDLSIILRSENYGKTKIEIYY